MAPLLEMRNVTKKFIGVVALNNVNIELNKGEILGICGENGAGKSTLMKVLSGSYTYKEYSGEIRIDGQPIKMDSVAKAQSLGIEMVYQEVNVMLDATVAENLFVGNLPGNRLFVDYKTLYDRASKELSRFNLEIDPRIVTRKLNSGQMQMLSIMRGVLKKPRILVLDEPTSSLTEQEVQLLYAMLKQLRKEGVACIYISHKLDEVFELCDRVTVLRDGETVSSHLITEINQDGLITEMVGRKVSQMYNHVSAAQPEVVMKVEHLSVPHPNIKGKYIVRDISFELHKGEILALGGLVGAGRSETLGGIFGQITNGVEKEITINGKKVDIKKPKDAINAGIGYITEERKLSGLVLCKSIRENMSLAMLDKLEGSPLIDLKKELAKLQGPFDELHIKAPTMEMIVNNLSGGNQQKVILGKWLLNDSKILFLDEPTKGIDVGAKNEFYNIIEDLTRQGVSIVLVSSDMLELISLSDRCLVLSGGRITAELEKEDITQVNIMKAAI